MVVPLIAVQPVALVVGEVQLTTPVIATLPADGKGVVAEPIPGVTREKLVAGGTSL